MVPMEKYWDNRFPCWRRFEHTKKKKKKVHTYIVRYWISIPQH
jgi:hypothetical protein